MIVTATVPLEVTVTDFDTEVPRATLPKESEVALELNAAVAALSWIAKLLDDELALAVSVPVCVVLTDATFTVNDAVVALDATITLPGTVTDVELLARDTL